MGENFVPRYKFELVKHSSDIEDFAAWLIIWSFPVGTLVGMLRNGGNIDPSHMAFENVHSAGVFWRPWFIFTVDILFFCDYFM